MDLQRMEKQFREVIERSDDPVMNAKEVAEALGTTPEAILNAAEGNHLPFGFIVSTPGTYRRSVAVFRKKLNDWWEGK